MSMGQFIDWGSPDTHLILNPLLPLNQKKNLHVSALPVMPAHLWLASSGTGSDSRLGLKLYALSKSAFLISAVGVNAHLQAKKTDGWLNVLPHFHVGGLSIFARAYLSGSKIYDRGGEAWSANKFHVWANDTQATLTSLVPTQLFDLVKLDRPAPVSLRAIVIGGAKLDPVLYSRARKLGYKILPSYGMTECCSQIATAALNSLDQNEYPELQVLSHVELKKMESGHLAIKSPSLFTAQGFWKTSETSSYFEILWRVGKWYVSQDLGDIHERKVAKDRDTIQIVEPKGRDSEEIKVSGELVNLPELNLRFKKLLGADEGTEFCVFSQFDERRGEEIVIALQTAVYALAEAWILKFNEEVLPVAKIRAAYFVDEIPKSDLGKIKTGDLKARLGF